MRPLTEAEKRVIYNEHRCPFCFSEGQMMTAPNWCWKCRTCEALFSFDLTQAEPPAKPLLDEVERKRLHGDQDDSTTRLPWWRRIWRKR